MAKRYPGANGRPGVLSLTVLSGQSSVVSQVRDIVLVVVLVLVLVFVSVDVDDSETDSA
jgi:hypothetical protein